YNVIKKYYDKPFKIRLVETVIPFPYRSSWTSFNESLVAILHWIHGLRTKLDIPYNVLAFSDSRSSLRDFMKAFNRRQIWEAEDHYDRVLLTPCSPRVEQGDKQRIKAQKTISEFIIAKYHKRTLLEAIYDNGEVEYLTRFHALTNYLDTKRFRDLTRHRISDNENFKEILEKVFGDVIDFCGKVKRYSELVSKYRYESLKLFEKVEKTPTIKPYYVVHHGKLDYDVRRKIEYLARRAEKGDSPSPYVIAATSTLEVGVDLPYVIAVLQYGTDALSPEIQQRIGRSGRSLNTFYISMGIIIFRNTGQDLFYYGDREIVSYVYSIKPRKLHAITRNEHLLAKYLTNFVEILDTSSCKIEDLAEKISQSYGLDMERLREDLEDWEKIAKSIDVEWSRLCEKQDWRNELRDLKYKLEKVSEDLRDIVRRSKSYSELRMMLEEPRRDVESMLNALREILSTGQNAISVSELVSILVKLSIMYRYIDALRREFSEYCKTYQVEEDLIKDIRSSMRDARVYLRDLIKNLLKELICSLEELFSENPCSSDERLREEFHGVLKWFAKNLVFPGIVDPVSARSLKYLLIKASLNRRNRCREYEKTSDYTELTQQAKPLHTGETR
ncbi:MAG: helicase-related protein, partial [Thermoprotei archaeon]